MTPCFLPFPKTPGAAFPKPPEDRGLTLHWLPNFSPASCRWAQVQDARGQPNLAANPNPGNAGRGHGLTPAPAQGCCSPRGSGAPQAQHPPGEGRPGSLPRRNQTLPTADKRDGAGCQLVESPSSLLAAQSSHLELFAVIFSPISISKAKLAGCCLQALF